MSRGLNFLALGNWDKNSYRIYLESLTKVLNPQEYVCIKHFEDKDVHSFNIHLNLDGTTNTVSNVVLIN